MASIKSRIRLLRREGYRLWRIAEMAGLDVDVVVEVLIEAGMIHPKMRHIIVSAERKPMRGG